jgi:RNA binding exosome subunit
MTISDAVLASKVQVGYIDIRVFAHATEDPERVLTATRNALPRESIDTVTFKKANLTGHHGNPIILIETRVKEKKQVQAAFEKLCSNSWQTTSNSIWTKETSTFDWTNSLHTSTNSS